MAADLPFISALCPTYRRPRCLANVLACWLAQDYPLDRRELIILDDGGNFAAQSGPGWRLIPWAPRIGSLPEKYNALAALASPDAFAFLPWEDDDVYLPDHVSRHAETLKVHEWAQPSRAWSNYGTPGTAIHEEDGRGRFHAGWSFRRSIFEALDGYPLTGELSFDQQMGGRLARVAPPGDTTATERPTYVFRWGNGYYHGQAHGDVFYGVCGTLGDPSWIGTLQPSMDAETERIYREVRA